MKTLSLLAVATVLGTWPAAVSAQQSETMYERGATYVENTMPPSPEPASVVKYADVPFTHSTGMAEYNVPFYTLQGRELSIPIGLHYASGGIKLDEIAGVAGLGWTLQAGGCVTRTVVDMPDEYESYIMHHEMPAGPLLTALENRVDTTFAMSYLRDLLYHRIDGSLDRYSYSICGLSGSFVIQDDGDVFHLSGDGVQVGYSRSADGSVETFTLRGPDGTVYTCSEKETATHDGRGDSPMTPTSGEPDRWSATTAWHLKSVRSRSGLETAELTYSDPAEWKRVVRASCRTVTETVYPDTQDNERSPQTGLSSKYIYSTYSTKVLSCISLNGDEVSFTYTGSTGSCHRNDYPDYQQNFPFSLSRISVRSASNPQELSRLDAFCGPAPHDGRILLNSLRLYKGGVLEDKWEFAYKTVETSISRGSQDWYGYYNGENEFSDEGTGSTCPYEYSASSGFVLTNGYPDPKYAAYLSLTSVDNDGARTGFAYEGSTIQDMVEDYSVGIRLKRIVLSEGMLPVRVRNFTYEYPHPSSSYVPSMDKYTSIDMSFRSPLGLVMQYVWSFALHDSPVSLGPSIMDARIYYGKVIEDVTDYLPVPGQPVTRSSRTVYEYSCDDVYPSTHYDVKERFPDPWERYYEWDHVPSISSPWVGVRTCYTEDTPSSPPLLTRREDYALENGEYRMVSSSDFSYERKTFGRALVSYYVSQIANHWLAGNLEYDYMYHFPVYAGSHPVKRPVKEVRVGYHRSGNDTTVVNTSYVNRTSLSVPERVSSVTMTSGNVRRQVNFGYADNGMEGEDWAQALASQHFLSVPVRKSVLYADNSTRMTVLPDTIIHVIPAFSPAFKEELTRYEWFNIGGQQYLLPSAHIEKNLGAESWRESVLSRDGKGNITSFKEKGRPETVVLWGYNALLPVAVIENASISEVYEALGGREVLIEASAGLDVPSDSYLQQLADLRTELPNAHVTTYTHIPGKGIGSVTDPAGVKTTFEYDHAGRLTCIRDNEGNKVEEYDYSLMADADKRRHMRSRVFRSADGQQFSEDVRWWDVYGRTLQDISIAASGDGKDLVTAYGSDFMFHDDVKTWLPYPVQNTSGAFQTEAESTAAGYHSSDLAYSFKNYEMSSRDRVLSTALPGYAGEHETTFETDVNAEFGALGQVLVDKMTDADGRVVSTYKDSFGKTLGTSCGSDEPTYYKYDFYDRLVSVAGSGIAESDTLNMWRYDYDSLGRLASKGIPGAVREYYTYDEEDRLVSVLRDGVLKEMEYDAMGRMTKVWQTLPGGQRVLMEEHTYDSYQPGVTGACPKGLKTFSRLAEIGPNGNVAGIVRVYYSYDEKKRPVKIHTRYNDGSEMVEQMQYTFAGEVESRNYIYICGSNEDRMEVSYEYDGRGRLRKEEAVLQGKDMQPQAAIVGHGYDALGRPSTVVSYVPGGTQLAASSAYALQGWQTSHSVKLNNRQLFVQNLGYDSQTNHSGHVPQHSGMVTVKSEQWHQSSGSPVQSQEWYVYDHAGRLKKEYADGQMLTYTYDSRGNILSAKRVGSAGQLNHVYLYDGDIVQSLTLAGQNSQQTGSFTHDFLGRMTFDGTTGQSMTYNSLDLVGKISSNGTTLVNYSYLSDGTKLSALDGSGEGLVYRGPFVYRKGAGNGNSSLTLESAAFGGGRLTPTGAMLYVTDYLGSVRAVVNGKTGELYKASDYSAFGEDSDVVVPQYGVTPAHQLATAALPDGLTLRDGYTGKEAQNPDFSTCYIDFGARQYNPALRRWMTPDPLSEKYYGISPYAFCNNNPVNLVDLDGERLCFADNVSDEFKQKFMQTFAYMIFRGTAGNLLRLHLSDRDYYIYEAFKSSDTRFGVKEGIQAIFWDPYHIVENHDGVWRSTATTLAHEAGHAVRYDEAKKNGTFYQWKQGTQIDTDPQYDTIEEKIVITTIEQDTARKHGEIADDQVTRTSHTGDQLSGDVKDKNPWEIQKIVSEHNELLR